MAEHEREKLGCPDPRGTISRRRFAVHAALTTAAAAYLPSSVVSAARESAAASPQAPPQAPHLSAEAQAEVNARVETILTRYGSRLSAEQKSEVRRLTVQLQPALESLRKASLENGDAPALFLKPLVEHEKKPAVPKPTGAKPAPPPKKS